MGLDKNKRIASRDDPLVNVCWLLIQILGLHGKWIETKIRKAGLGYFHFVTGLFPYCYYLRYGSILRKKLRSEISTILRHDLQTISVHCEECFEVFRVW